MKIASSAPLRLELPETIDHPPGPWCAIATRPFAIFTQKKTENDPTGNGSAWRHASVLSHNPKLRPDCDCHRECQGGAVARANQTEGPSLTPSGHAASIKLQASTSQLTDHRRGQVVDRLVYPPVASRDALPQYAPGDDAELRMRAKDLRSQRDHWQAKPIAASPRQETPEAGGHTRVVRPYRRLLC